MIAGYTLKRDFGLPPRHRLASRVASKADPFNDSRRAPRRRSLDQMRNPS
jgi:hypothetical protein